MHVASSWYIKNKIIKVYKQVSVHVENYESQDKKVYMHEYTIEPSGQYLCRILWSWRYLRASTIWKNMVRISCSGRGFTRNFRYCARVLRVCVFGSVCMLIIDWNVHAYLHVVCTHTHTRTCMHAQIHKHMHTNAHMACTHVHIYMQMKKPPHSPSIGILHLYHKHSIFLKVVIVTNDVGMVKHGEYLDLVHCQGPLRLSQLK